MYISFYLFLRCCCFLNYLQSNLNGSNIFGTIKIRSSHWGLIMAPIQETNSDNLGNFFRFSTQWLYVECTHKNRLDEAILMSTLNIQFHDKKRKNPYIFASLSYWKDFIGTEKRVRIIHGKRVILVVILYMFFANVSHYYYLVNNVESVKCYTSSNKADGQFMFCWIISPRKASELASSEFIKTF